MTWNAFFTGLTSVAKIIGLIIRKILIFAIKLTILVIKFTLFLFLTILTLGKLGVGTMDIGNRRR